MKFGVSNSLNTKSQFKFGGKTYTYFDINKASELLKINIHALPHTMRIVLENMLRFEDDISVKRADIEAIAKWMEKCSLDQEIAFYPARVLMQDFTGVPAVVDLAAMRDAAVSLGFDPQKINPLIPVDLVIDHSVQVDKYATPESFQFNVNKEMERNKERYEFLKWGQKAFKNFRCVPPGTGICHQVNLELLGQVIWTEERGSEIWAYPDTLVGTDSHTTMINGLGILGWGVGGIEAEAAMLGQPLSMSLPEVIGFEIKGKLKEGTTATDLVLTVTQMLRNKGVVNKFVEFHGEGLDNLTVADRATISNMAPEYGATCGYFPIDNETLKYMKLSGRKNEHIDFVEAFAQMSGMWRKSSPKFTDGLSLDLSSVEPCLAGPKRPQDRVVLSAVNENFNTSLPSLNKNHDNEGKTFKVGDGRYSIKNGDIVISAITSCTNTSNPSVMMGAALIAKKANALGLKTKPWVKTSLAPGSKVVTDYLEKSDLQKDLNTLGFNLVGYGCTTCIGNSGPLLDEIEKTISENNLVVASVLSGNRNFEGRIHPLVRANYLASPMICVIYALVGNINCNILTDEIGRTPDGKAVYLKDLWPSSQEIQDYVSKFVQRDSFNTRYMDVFSGDEVWKSLKAPEGANYAWNNASTYIKCPPYFTGMTKQDEGFHNIENAKILAIFGDSITTDHISPAGSIAANSPAAKYLNEHGIERADFNSYGARRGNHEVMMRGTFANIRIKNELLDGTEGGYTKVVGDDDVLSIFDASQKYEKTPLVVFAGKEYGTGSSRDWAAKGPMLQGVRAVIAESFERIHRSNLVGMGIIPLVFENGMTRHDLKLDGSEIISIEGLDTITPKKQVVCHIKRKSGAVDKITLKCRVDTEIEVRYIKNGGILKYVLRNM